MSQRLRILIAPQEFKGSLTAGQAAAAMTGGARRAGEFYLDELPLSDGGPGLVEALVAAEHGETRGAAVQDPLGRTVSARYGLLHAGRTGVVELAAASGLSLLARSELDSRRASTYGTGQLIKAALDDGVDELIIGIGGSATNDGGAGLATALGARLLDGNGRSIGAGGAALSTLARIDVSALDPRLRRVRVVAASDVRNPLCGPNGASAIFGPQKGADQATVDELDAALAHYAAIVKRDLGMSVAEIPGAGAAGGAGAGLLAFLNAEITSGFDVVARATRLEQRLKTCHLVLTGEGSLDRQTAYGKTVGRLAELCKKHKIPVVALAGAIDRTASDLFNTGLTAAFSILAGPATLEEAETNAHDLLSDRAEAVMRLFAAVSLAGGGRGASEPD
jgi:glycerate 2-kinase